MKALHLRYSAANRGDEKNICPKMPPEFTEAVAEAQNAAMTAQQWLDLAIAAILGGTSSALWTIRSALRDTRRRPRFPHWTEIISTALCSALVAVAFAAYFAGKMATPMVIVSSILCGFGGEPLIRIVATGFTMFVKSWISAVAKDKEQATREKEDSDEP